MKTDLNVGTGCWYCVRLSCIDEANETLGSFKLLRRRPIMPISFVDSSEGLVFNELIVRMIEVSSSCKSNSKDKNIL